MHLARGNDMDRVAARSQQAGEIRDDLLVFHVAGCGDERDGAAVCGRGESVCEDTGWIARCRCSWGDFRHRPCEKRGFRITARHVGIGLGDPPAVGGEMEIETDDAGRSRSQWRVLLQNAADGARKTELLQQFGRGFREFALGCKSLGSKLLREALADVRDGAASAPEARAARALRRSKEIPPFEQNVEIRLPDGRAFVADFYWRALRAILEIDSVEFHFDPADWRATMDRHLALTTLGLAVVHRPPSALRDEARFVADIAAWLANRSREVGRIA